MLYENTFVDGILFGEKKNDGTIIILKMVSAHCLPGTVEENVTRSLHMIVGHVRSVYNFKWLIIVAYRFSI